MTMIRTLLCAILIGTACQATANTLYRWTEADGSITFSPSPPASGVAYETIETGGGNANIERPAQAPAAPQAPTAPISAPQARITAVPTQIPAAAAEPAQGLAYAPAAQAALPGGITWDKQAQGAAAVPSQTQTLGGNNTGVIGSSKKTSQCLDLEKRVMSLERRLRSKLSPDEVDNTVVAIVRYQDSFDQYCG